MIGVLLALSAWLVWAHLGRPEAAEAPALRGLFTWRNAAFFFLGAGFLLVETKGVTELGLVFGNTWSVVAVVVGGILLMVYLANGWVARRGAVSSHLAFALLAASLAAGWAVSRLASGGAAVPWPQAVMPVLLTLPLFFAGLIFSTELTRPGEIGPALAANLFGGMLGGFLEYNSMYWGLGSLYPLGLALYAAAYGCVLAASRRRPATAPGEWWGGLRRARPAAHRLPAPLAQEPAPDPARLS
jgi:hypothetical protein